MIRAQNAIKSFETETPKGMKGSIVQKALLQMFMKMHIGSDKILSIQFLKCFAKLHHVPVTKFNVINSQNSIAQSLASKDKEAPTLKVLVWKNSL